MTRKQQQTKTQEKMMTKTQRAEKLFKKLKEPHRALREAGKEKEEIARSWLLENYNRDDGDVRDIFCNGNLVHELGYHAKDLGKWGQKHGVLERTRCGWRLSAEYEGWAYPMMVEHLILSDAVDRISRSRILTASYGDEFIAWEILEEKVNVLSSHLRWHVKSYWEHSKAEARKEWSEGSLRVQD